MTLKNPPTLGACYLFLIDGEALLGFNRPFPLEETRRAALVQGQADGERRVRWLAEAPPPPVFLAQEAGEAELKRFSMTSGCAIDLC